MGMANQLGPIRGEILSGGYVYTSAIIVGDEPNIRISFQISHRLFGQISIIYKLYQSSGFVRISGWPSSGRISGQFHIQSMLVSGEPGLIFEAGFPLLLGIAHISEVPNPNLSSLGSHHKLLPGHRHCVHLK